MTPGSRIAARLLKSAALPLALLLVVPVFLAQEGTLSPESFSKFRLSSDPFTNSTSQHHTQVEPDSFSFGSTIVTAFQSGRFYDGGSSDIGFATSHNNGASWVSGFLPGITNVQKSGNPYDRDSDPSVAYDPLHNVWLISSLPIVDSGAPIPAVIVSRSIDGGYTWGNPVSVTGNVYSSDKDWIVCDTWASSPHYGNCYVEWDDPSQGDYVYMSTSTDGGATWGSPQTPSGGAYGLGGQPVVQPNGNVVVPFESNDMETFMSADGGVTWSAASSISYISDHFDAGNIRSSPLPSAAVDGGGTVYVVWEDCRFRTGCAENDIVLSTSTDGVHWTGPARLPEDSKTSAIDHFIPGIGVNTSTSGSTAHVAVAYYFYPQTNCTVTTCRLGVDIMTSANGGATWTAPKQIVTGMQLTWLPITTLGYMVGDYISTSYANGKALPIYAFATANSGSVFNEAMYTTSSGFGPEEGAPTYSSVGDLPVPNAKSDHGPRLDQGERGRKLPPGKLALKRVKK